MPTSPEQLQRLQQVWYGGAAPSLGLRLLAAVYGLARGASLIPWALRLRRPQVFDVPVIVVGNLTAGGTGKTPLVIALVQALRARGVGVGVISRGYGRSTRGVRLVDQGASAAEVGDEPLLIARRTGAPVVVGEDRVAALKRLIGLIPLDVVIADDGLEHHRLGRRCEIVVVDGTRGFGNGRLLPAGPLRAPLTRLKRVHALVWNGGGPDALSRPTGPIVAHALSSVMQIQASTLRPLGGGRAESLQAWRGRRAHVVAGTGNPERVFATVRELGIEVIPHALADHVDYAQTGVPQFDDDLPCITTEKDATKLPAQSGWYVLEVSAKIEPALLEHIRTCVGLELEHE